MTGFDTLSEVIVYVQDMDRMLSFYTDVLGLEIAAGNPEHGFVEFDTGTCSFCLHAGGEGDLGEDAPKFVFGVEDVEAARSYLQDHDVELGEVRSPAPGMEVCDGLDPEGNAFSIESSAAPE
jgi:catechol 2,3-dioxygenase-like lactoylglutathione lyase family enzyme